MKDHEKRELVNRLTDIARDYVHTKQLRELIAWEVLQAIEAAKREALLEAADKLANDWNCIGGFPEDRLRRMAEELK